MCHDYTCITKCASRGKLVAMTTNSKEKTTITNEPKLIQFSEFEKEK